MSPPAGSAIKAMAVKAKNTDVALYSYSPKPLEPEDVEFTVHYCGVCHSDIANIDNEWGLVGDDRWPIIPGHEAVGVVEQVGDNVTRFQVGDFVGLGFHCYACLTDCVNCKKGLNNVCQHLKYSCVANMECSVDNKIYPHHGGFGQRIVTPQCKVFKIPSGCAKETCGPLLCAGVTVYSPLKRWGVISGERKQVGILGVGGLGHLAIQYAAKAGAVVTAITTTEGKRDFCESLGATHILVSRNESAMEAAKAKFDFILCTVAANIDFDPYLEMLAPNGVLCFVGVPSKPVSFEPRLLVRYQCSIVGSVIGNNADMEEVLQFSADNDVQPIIEMFPLKDAQQAIDKVRNNSVRFRAVLDCSKID